MADLGFGDDGFKADAPENQKTRKIIPKDIYPAVMIASEKMETKDKTGSYLKTTWQIVSGEHQNMQLFSNFNLWLAPINDKKKEAIQIAKGQFSELCKAINILSPTDSSQLHFKKVFIKVKVRENDEYGAQNEIYGFKPFSQSELAAKAPPVMEQPTVTTPPSNEANPWG